MHTLDEQRKLVSIVLPVYNGARFLRQSIDSCLQQTYRHIELIIVDDGSEDNSIDIVKSYHDDRIKLICHQTNQKLPAALNTGFGHARGVYLTWTSHDNYYEPTAIAEMVSFLEENSHIHFVFANNYLVDEADHILRLIKAGPVEQIAEKSCVGGCFLYKRTVYEKVGPYNERTFLAEDYDYWLRALTAGFTLAHLDLPLYFYRWHADSLSVRFGEVEGTEMALAVRRQVLGRHLWRNRMALSRSHLTAAFRFCNGNRRPAAVRAALWGIIFNPGCLLEYPVQVLLIELCAGPRGFRFLQRLKHAIRRSAIDHL
jgi:glycosyltransferase involved in cell wall biosynthesis